MGRGQGRGGQDMDPGFSGLELRMQLTLLCSWGTVGGPRGGAGGLARPGGLGGKPVLEGLPDK